MIFLKNVSKPAPIRTYSNCLPHYLMVIIPMVNVLHSQGILGAEICSGVLSPIKGLIAMIFLKNVSKIPHPFEPIRTVASLSHGSNFKGEHSCSPFSRNLRLKFGQEYRLISKDG